VLDASSKGLSLEETIREIEAVDPQILGLSVVTYRAWAMTEILKKTSCPTKVVGGPHATTNYDAILKQGATAVFVGDAEVTFPKWIEDGCPNGVFFGQPVDLNRLPFPARDLVDFSDYKIAPNEQLLFDVGPLRMPIFSSKGCPNRCVFCDVQQKSFNWKTPERIVQEFHSIIDLGATSIHILDDCFNIRKDRVKKMCSLLSEYGVCIDWSVRGAVETNEDVIRSLSEAGCKRFHVGIEHLDDEVLKYFGKRHRRKQIEKFCELCGKHGIRILAYFIIGAPGETRQYREELPMMIKNLNIAIPFFNVLSPLKDTAYYGELFERGVFERDFWADFVENPVKDFVMPSGRSKAQEDELEATLKCYMEDNIVSE